MGRTSPGTTADSLGELAAALDRFTIRSLWTYQFDDQPLIDVRLVSAVPMQEGDSAPLIRAIQMTFYDRCYARRPARAAPIPAEPESSDA
jgi:hypothetical protein